MTINLNTQALAFLWAKSIGSNGNDICHPIAVDDSGNVIIAGSYEGTVDFDPGSGVFNLVSGINNAGYISKLDSAGNFVWAKQLNGQYSDIGQSIAFDKQNHLFITGSYMSSTLNRDADTLINIVTSGATADIFIAKLDSGISTTGLSSIATANNLLVYPNPAKDVFISSYPQATNGIMNVTLADITEKIVYKKFSENTERPVVDTRTLAIGLYIVQVQSASFVATKKIMIDK